jgi:hypothetical protein
LARPRATPKFRTWGPLKDTDSGFDGSICCTATAQAHGIWRVK